MKKIELLAPAGDLQRAKIAIRYGANAVYLGGKRFSLRSRASNFDIEDIKQACDFAKAHNAHIHVTINMIPHNEDLQGIKDYLKTLEDIGVTAVIVASASFIQIVKEVAPKLEVHLSTQMNSLNSQTVDFFKKWKVDRVVLGRECSIEDIKKIGKVASLPIETFIHGGMCSNYSGRCTLSNRMTLRDANRGGCAQSCRWKYHLLENDKVISDDEILLSMSSKDLMAHRYVEDMIHANVSSLKIEGRMKSEYYIAQVVKTYRKLIDEVYATGHLSEERLTYYAKEFNKAENRPTADGFLSQIPGENHHLYGVNGAGVTHDFVGYVKSYNEDTQIAMIEVRNYFKTQDHLEVFGPTIDNEDFIVETLHDEENQDIEIANKPMQLLQCKIPFKVSPHDMIRKVRT
ncbi:MAG: U32 family peptidase [Erysipelotrichaceae bacterium]